MRRIDVSERRARLAVRHRLAPASAATDGVDVAASLVALHATDPAAVFLAVRARAPATTSADVEAALYTDRSLVRMLGMRRTMFVVPVELAPVIEAACTRSIAVLERRRLLTQLAEAAIAPDVTGWLAEVEAATMAALAARGSATAAELAADVPSLRAQMSFGEGRRWAGVQAVSTRVLFLLAAEGRIIRGRPRGGWTSSLYRWEPTTSWLPGGTTELPREEAQAELVRRWLATYGPGTEADLAWWTGWTRGQVRQALAKVGPVEVEIDGATGLALATDVEAVSALTEPWVALLPALDPTVMGWAGRAWYLGSHAPVLFDRSGNVGPTAWCDGRIVGGWAQRRDGEVVVRLLDDVGTSAAAAIDAEADRLRSWLGSVRVTPRIRTPLERELTS
jgi:Winged helix DNA-binding domain